MNTQKSLQETEQNPASEMLSLSLAELKQQFPGLLTDDEQLRPIVLQELAAGELAKRKVELLIQRVKDEELR